MTNTAAEIAPRDVRWLAGQTSPETSTDLGSSRQPRRTAPFLATITWRASLPVVFTGVQTQRTTNAQNRRTTLSDRPDAKPHQTQPSNKLNLQKQNEQNQRVSTISGSFTLPRPSFPRLFPLPSPFLCPSFVLKAQSICTRYIPPCKTLPCHPTSK